GAAHLFKRWLAGENLDERPSDLRRQLVAFAGDPGIQAVIAEAVGRESTPLARRSRLLEVMGAAFLNPWPTSWIDALRMTFRARDEALVRQAVAVVRSRDRAEYDDLLLGLVEDPSRGEDLRIEALEVVANRLQRLTPPLFEFLVARLSPEEPQLRR